MCQWSALSADWTYQKGFNLVVDEMRHIYKRDVQVVLLGTGKPKFEHDFAYFGQAYPDKSLQYHF